MQLKSTRLERSPLADDRLRLSGDVVFDDGASKTFWYDVAEKDSEWLTSSGNPWLTALCPVAFFAGEPLKIELPVDRTLYESLHDVMDVWHYWYPHLKQVPIEADNVSDAAEDLGAEPDKVALFYSGGVDSSFTLLKHVPKHTPDAPVFVNDLFFAGGFGLLMKKPEATASRMERVGRVASEYGLGSVLVFTNLREDHWRTTKMWSALACGPTLASMGMLFEKKYRKLFISSSYNLGGTGDLPYGSHAITDHMLSTRRTNVVHYGADTLRAEKVALLAESDVILKSLHVCWHHEDDYNCCACMKCYEAMIALDLAGALGRAARFDKKLDLAGIERVFYANDVERSRYQELYDLAVKKERRDLADALRKSFQRSRQIHASKKRADWLTTKPLFWRLAGPYRKRVKEALGDSIRALTYGDVPSGIPWGELKG
jgi:hypothetical protein